ncbi:MAG: tetratricopeptide repeat protein, partial [Geminicoccaceae bacterium]|nr:tetratricopeptide repeat protein [Geminicoccaceae bacterium]
AIEAYRQVLVREPHHVAARHNLANLFAEGGDDLAAAAEFRHVLAIAPELAEAHYNLARVLLRLGDYGTAFAEYSWRWRVRGFPDRPRRSEIPVWNGGPIRGLTVLAQAEQGLGDTIQMVRLLPLLASLGCTVILEVPRSLVELMEGISGADRVVSADAPNIDARLRVPLFDLPAKLGLTLGSIPAAVPYLRTDPSRTAMWRERLGGPDGRHRVGICWRGNPNAPVDPGRSLSGPGELASALASPDVRLIALCLPEAHPLERSDAGLGWRLAGLSVTVEHAGTDLDAGGDAFLDTAAILQGLDLIVTTDTAVAHLAVALGRPTLLLLPAVADWRWLRGRADSPWYPTFRLLRQPRRGDWTSVLREARREVDRRKAGCTH